MTETLTGPPSAIEASPDSQNHELRERLSHQIDWDALIEASAEKSADVDIALLLRTLSFPNHPTNSVGREYDADVLTAYWKALEQYQLPAPEETEMAENIASGNLCDAILDWTHLNKKATAVFVSKARLDQLQEAASYDSQYELALLARFAGLDGNGGNKTPAVIADAIERAAARRMAAFDRSDFDITAKLRAERPNMTLVTGHQLLSITTGEQNPHAWIQRELDLWPDWLSSGMGRLKIEGNIVNKQLSDGWEQAGGWKQAENRLRISAKTAAYYYRRAQDTEQGMGDDASKTLQQFVSRGAIRHTLIHESMHNAHQNTIPVRWLRQWCAIVSTDTTAVTEYVELSRKNDTVLTALREDLCESAEQYGHSPATLARKSFPRFAALQELFDGYSATDLQDLLGQVEALDDNDSDLDDKIIDLDIEFSRKFVARHHTPVFERP